MIEKRAMKFALVVCTINRSTLVESLLIAVGKQSSKPDCVVVVDSSPDDQTKSVVENFRAPFDLHYVHSQKGLPHQRNVGIKTIEEVYALKNLDYVGFLDDDVSISPDYFQCASEALAENPKAILVGGYDKLLSIRATNRIEQILQLNSKKMGQVLRSGLVTYVKPEKKFEEVTWVPGHSFNVRASAFESVKFRGHVRMYGEDVEIQIRLGKLGQIIAVKDMGVVHYKSDVSRESLRNNVAYDDGFRFWLSGQHPEIVKKRWVIVSTVLLATRSFLLSFSNDGITHRLVFKGHLDFFRRLIARKQIEQFVEHDEWVTFEEW